MPHHPRTLYTLLCLTAFALTTACSSLKTPATADVAVSKAAVESAAGAGGVEYAPVEMHSAREKLAQANSAMAAKDYQPAVELANSAQADARLAQGKANSAGLQPTPCKTTFASCVKSSTAMSSNS